MRLIETCVVHTKWRKKIKTNANILYVNILETKGVWSTLPASVLKIIAVVIQWHTHRDIFKANVTRTCVHNLGHSLILGPPHLWRFNVLSLYDATPITETAVMSKAQYTTNLAEKLGMNSSQVVRGIRYHSLSIGCHRKAVAKCCILGQVNRVAGFRYFPVVDFDQITHKSHTDRRTNDQRQSKLPYLCDNL